MEKSEKCRPSHPPRSVTAPSGMSFGSVPPFAPSSRGVAGFTPVGNSVTARRTRFEKPWGERGWAWVCRRRQRERPTGGVAKSREEGLWAFAATLRTDVSRRRQTPLC